MSGEPLVGKFFHTLNNTDNSTCCMQPAKMCQMMSFITLRSLHNGWTPHSGWFPGCLWAPVPCQASLAAYRGSTGSQSKWPRELRRWIQKERPMSSEGDPGMAEAAQSEALLEDTDRGSQAPDCGRGRGCCWLTRVRDWKNWSKLVIRNCPVRACTQRG